MDYTDLRKHADSPLGELCVGRHAVSNEIHALKILRQDLTGNAQFLEWYGARLALAGSLQRLEHIPTLIAPAQHPDGRFLFRLGDRYATSRGWIGEAAEAGRQAWNLNELLHEFGRKEGGLGEREALAIMQLITETVLRMHDARITGPDGATLNGVPHLNLRPQNVLVASDPDSGLYQVYLTDPCVNLASAVMARLNIDAPMNYCPAEQLGDPTYSKLNADIFACGLLLHRLLENKDLIPANLSRENTRQWIQTVLPGYLKKLKYKGASSKVTVLVKRCLSANSGEQYAGIDELHSDVSRLARSRAPEVLASMIRGRKARKPGRPAKGGSPKLKSGGKHWVELVLWAVLLIAVGVGGWYTYVYLDERGDAEECRRGLAELQELTDRLGQAPKICSGCIDLQSLERAPRAVNRYYNSRNWDSALATIRGALNQAAVMASTVASCRQFQNLRESGQERMEEGRRKGCPRIAAISRQFNVRMDSAEASLRGCDYILYGDHLMSATVILDGICREAIAKDDKPKVPSGPWVCSQNELDGLRRLVAGLGPDCEPQGMQILSNAEEACNQNIEDRYKRRRRELRDHAANCPDAHAAVAQAESVKAAAVQSCEKTAGYQTANDDLQAARDHLQGSRYTQAAWRAAAAASGFEAFRACADLEGPRRNIRICREDMLSEGRGDQIADLMPLFDSLDFAYQSCLCADALILADRLWAELEPRCFGDDGGSVVIPEPIRRDPTDVDSCIELYYAGADVAAMDCLQLVPLADPDYDMAQKYLVLARGCRLHIYDDTTRQAFFAARSALDFTQTDENMCCFLTAAWCLASDPNNMDCRQARQYCDSTRAFPGPLGDSPDRWRINLIDTRCAFEDWQLTRDTREWRDAYRRCDEFKKKYGDWPNLQTFRNEVQRYVDSLDASQY